MLVVASCTQSKRGSPRPAARLRSYRDSGVSVPQICRSWQEGVARSTAVRVVRDLYKGAYWAQVIALSEGLGARVGVVSAGFGYITDQAKVPCYSATFSAGHPDSVPGASTADGRRAWWRLLGGDEGLSAALAESNTVVAVLPERYLDVVSPDLLAVPAERLIVFSTGCPPELAKHLEDRWIRLDARMVRSLGTNVSALAPTAALRALSRVEAQESIGAVAKVVETFVAADAPPLYPKRQRQTPDQVEAWIRRSIKATEPPTSASAALRRFRDEGLAFEQKRFHQLYRELLEEIGAR